MYNKDSFYVNEEKMILVKNKDILRILSAYKLQTYEGKVHRVHFKDIYQILVKRVFKEEFDDFEISKYLKTKMKNQWLEKHKKVKELPKTGFKAHQGFASKIITEYAKRYRFRQEQQPGGPSKQSEVGSPSKDEAPAQDLKFGEKSEADGQDGRAVLRDTADLKKLKQAAASDFKVGFVGDRPSQDQDNEKADHTKQRQRQGGSKHIDGIDLDAPGTAAGVGQRDESRGDQLPAIHPQGRTRYKNKDENPQEFEEVGSQEEQSQGRAIEQINFNRERIARDDNGSDQNADSMLASAQNLQFNIKMGQSITDSAMGKSDSNMILLSPKDDVHEDEGLIIASRSGNIDGNL